MVIAIKEKIAFWGLFVLFVSIFSIGLLNYYSRHIDTDEWFAITGRDRAREGLKELIPPSGPGLDSILREIPESEYAALLERNIFFRYVSQAKKEGEATQKETGRREEKEVAFLFKGKMVVNNRVVVILEESASKKTHLVGKGDVIGGYRVIDVKDDEVVISKEPEEFHIKLFGPERESK